MASNRNVWSAVVRIGLSILFAVGAGVCLYLIAGTDLTSRESALLGFIVTLLSVLASWIITDMYATSQYGSAIKEVKEEHTKNLRTYALKAAEKVNNLSSELNKLAVYLEEELNYTDYRTTDEELLAKEERMESAIHVIHTLKSVNDTGLSDWEGVIGDELDQQREEQEEKQNHLKQMISRVEAVIEGQRQENTGAKQMRRELEDLRKDLRLAMSQLNETSIPKSVRNRAPKQAVVQPCPECGAALSYRQRPSSTSFKLVSCTNCNKKSVASYEAGAGFKLNLREAERIKLPCVYCKVQVEAELDNLPDTSTVVGCDSCARSFRLLRTKFGIEARAEDIRLPSRRRIEDAVIEQVRAKMPAQPWPKGVHLEVASQIGLPARIVQRAIRELIKSGVFYPQFDGVVFTPDKQVQGRQQTGSTLGEREATPG